MTLSLSTAQQTEGPWQIIRDPYLGDDILSITSQARVDADLVEIAQVTIGYNEPFEAEQQANARLIAAAPELLDALRQAKEWLEGWGSAERQLAVIDAAISKATGAA